MMIRDWVMQDSAEQLRPFAAYRVHGKRMIPKQWKKLSEVI